MDTQATGAASSLFPQTHWSVVLAAGAKRDETALAELCRAYWYPLYAYARRRGHPPADAEDLTQGFFAHLLSGELVARADAAKGRFRHYLLHSFHNFMVSEWKRATAQKRGGGHSVVPFDVAEAETRFAGESVDRQSPERIFERNWAVAVLDEAAARLQAELQDSGRERLFLHLHRFLEGDVRANAYAEVAQALQTTEGTVKVAVYRLRQRYRELLRAVVARTVETPLEVEEELRHLQSVFQA